MVLHLDCMSGHRDDIGPQQQTLEGASTLYLDAYTLTHVVSTRTNFSHQGAPGLSQRDVESTVLFQPKLVSLPGYECELGDVDREVTV